MIGDNNPPEAMGPFDALAAHIDDLVELAASCLTGKPIETQEQADAVDEILADIKKARKDADDARDAEKRPYLEAGRKVDATWKPLLSKTDIAKETAQKALTPWKLKLQAERDAAIEAKRIEAARLAEEARKAFQESNVTDLDARLAADELAKQAKKATAEANKVERVATGLRTSWKASVTDYGAFLSWMKTHRPHELKAWLDDHAQRECNAGQRHVAGVLITEVKEAR